MDTKTPESLFEGHLGQALKIGRSFLVPNSTTDECEQEARIALWHAAQTFDPTKGEFAAFASVVVRNHLRNFFNAAKRRSAEIAVLDSPSSGDSESEIDFVKDSIVSPDASPLLDAERSDIRSALQAELARLTASQQEVLKMHANGDSYAEIARRFGVSKAAVRQMAERAANQIRPELQYRGISIHYLPSHNPEYSHEGSGRGEFPRKDQNPPRFFWHLAVVGIAFTIALLIFLVLG